MHKRIFQIKQETVLFGIQKVDDFSEKLSEQENKIIYGSNSKRIKEFSTARVLAKELLARLKYDSINVLTNKFGAPVWPGGIIGSISHSSDLCFVAVAKLPHKSIGIDMQKIIPTIPEFTNMVLTKREREENRTQSNWELSLITNIIFSIKESVYKCLAHDKEISLDFQDIETRYHKSRFIAKIIKYNLELIGIYKISKGYIFSGLIN